MQSLVTMSKIYAVTSGEYSDYGINAVFDNKEAAEKYAYPIDDSYVEEYELNPRLPSWVKPNHKFYHLRMFQDGTCKSVYQSSPPLTDKKFSNNIGFDEHK